MPFRLATDPAHTGRASEDFAAGARTQPCCSTRPAPLQASSRGVYTGVACPRLPGALLLAQTIPDLTLTDALSRRSRRLPRCAAPTAIWL